MKEFILAHSSAEMNHKPARFPTAEEAVEALTAKYRELYEETDEVSCSLDWRHCELIHDDDTYDRLDVFEVE